ncbi:MAG: bifunctional adenosylcobinamide kinase/adenosylcobinamide-phosphate guanylyltransferase [Oscillospiraceae bacterium]|nr:bifunctional adenosylcobinamide kinase/adenosylcobinamide-phosphate guanylyltransferase [Oscillospiraceae bacterium]
MAKITFITGGTASGKTRWAVTNFAACDNVLYMAVAGKLDSDTARRVEFNCKERDVEWDIKLSAENLAEMARGRKFSILDNLGAYVNRIAAKKCPDISDIDNEIRREIEQQAIAEITELLTAVRESNGNLIIISTELGYCPLPAEKEARWFREILGNVNQRIANISNEVYLSASGITFKIKGDGV